MPTGRQGAPNGGYLRIAADQRWLQAVIRFRARHRAERRLGALGWRFNGCPGRAQIIGFCVRGVERAKTFTAAGSAGAWMVAALARLAGGSG